MEEGISPPGDARGEWDIAGGVTGIRQVTGAIPCLPPVGVGGRDCPPGGCGGRRMPCAQKQATCRSTGQRKWTAWRLPVHGMEKCRRRDRAGAEECPGAGPASA